MKIGLVTGQFGNIFRGGAEIQYEGTLNALRSKGINAEEINNKTRSINNLDILHFFKTDESYIPLVNYAKALNKKVVLSSIIYPESKGQRVFNITISKLKKNSFIRKLPNAQRIRLLEAADLIFPNTIKELEYIQSIANIKKSCIIPNCIDDYYFNGNAESTEIFYSKYPKLKGQNFVLNVGRISTRKNQLNLIKACKSLSLKLLLIGDTDEPSYLEKCKSAADDNVIFHGFEGNKSFLLRAYREAHIFALPSTMETPGLSALEAAVNGCQIIITSHGGAEEYFGDYALYLDKRDNDEIISKIKEILKRKKNPTFNSRLNYRYERAADMYNKSYQALMNE